MRVAIKRASRSPPPEAGPPPGIAGARFGHAGLHTGLCIPLQPGTKAPFEFWATLGFDMRRDNVASFHWDVVTGIPLQAGVTMQCPTPLRDSPPPSTPLRWLDCAVLCACRGLAHCAWRRSRPATAGHAIHARRAEHRRCCQPFSPSRCPTPPPSTPWVCLSIPLTILLLLTSQPCVVCHHSGCMIGPELQNISHSSMVSIAPPASNNPLAAVIAAAGMPPLAAAKQRLQQQQAAPSCCRCVGRTLDNTFVRLLFAVGAVLALVFLYFRDPLLKVLTGALGDAPVNAATEL